MSLYYSSLITALCAASEVQYGPNEDSLAPMSVITDNKVKAMKGNNILGPVVQGSQPHKQSSTSSSSRNLTIVEQMERLEGKMHQQGEQLQQLTNYQYTCKTSIKGMMRVAIGIAVDMEQFLMMLAFMCHPLAEEHASS